MDEHIPTLRLLALSEDNTSPEGEELEHLVGCRSCFDLMTSFIKDRREQSGSRGQRSA